MAKLAINGAKPVFETMFYKPWPIWDNRERKGLLDILENGAWWYGAKVK